MLDIVIFNKDKEKVEKTIQSILSMSGFSENQLTLYFMDFCDEANGSMPSCLSRDHVVYINVQDKTDAEVYNLALKEANGDYITFITQDIIYSRNALVGILEAISQKKRIISLLPYSDFGEKSVLYPAINPLFDKDGLFDVCFEQFSSAFHICFSAFVFSRSLFEGVVFDERMVYDSEWKAVIPLLDQEQGYTFVNGEIHYSYADEREYFNFLPQFDKQWYMDSMQYFLVDAVRQGDSVFKQKIILYLIACRYNCNMNERDKSVLSPDEAEWFIAQTGTALKNIEDVVIANHMLNGRQAFPQFFALNLLRMKYDDSQLFPEIVSTGRGLTAYYKDCQLWSVGGLSINFRVIYFDGTNLLLDGLFSGSYVFKEGDMEIVAVLNDSHVYPVRRNYIYSLSKFFNITAKRDYTFQMSIPESELKDGMTIAFYLVYKNNYYGLSAKFTRPESKLGGFAESYWVFNEHILTYNKKSKKFLVEDLTRQRVRNYEKKLLKAIARSTSGSWRLKMVGHRLLYWVTKPLYRKKIWITMDKLFKAGDNGEYFYRYVMAQKPKDVQIYYIVNADSPDYERLKKEYRTVVKFNSLHHKLLALHTDLMLATHVDTMTCNGYYHDLQKYFRDLYNARVVCLAHGLTIQKIAQYQSRTFDNTVLYFFASKYEVSNVSHEIYDYYDRSMLKLTGHARYDGLVNNDQKIILITPTWRRGITTGTAKKGASYSHSDSFKNSEYYRIYNGLISDPVFIESARKNGYRIVYLLHPAMSSQIEDFEVCDGVEIVAATSDISYEKILTESSLMVTDYSGVQFDFAYMKKPLVYYHPDTLPPQYESSGLVYETMGFGPICRNHETIVRTLCDYMDRQCIMEDEYKRRVKDFFQYSDHNNCARIYEEVIKFQEQFDKVDKLHYKR